MGSILEKKYSDEENDEDIVKIQVVFLNFEQAIF
jgi:hypothetical protein